MERLNKLAPSEIERIKSFMKIYSDFFDRVQILQEKLEEVENSKTKLTQEIQKVSEELESTRIEESEYQKTLIAKYGEFHLDLETFEYRIS